MQKKKQIENAVTFLHTHLSHIHTVSEWAHAEGYTRAYFSVLIKQQYGDSPYHIIKREKYAKIEWLVHSKPELTGRMIAQRAGFDSVESLYKFLRRDFNTNLTGLRNAEFENKV